MPLKPTTQAWQSELGQNIGDLLATWRPEQEDRAQVTADWSQLIAAPAMQTWSRYVAPFLKESLNIPGAIGRSTGQGLALSAEQFFTSNVLPTLFSSLQEASNRNLQGQNIWANILGTGAGLSTAQTLQYSNKPNWQQNFATLMGGLESAVNAGVGTVGAASGGL